MCTYVGKTSSLTLHGIECCCDFFKEFEPLSNDYLVVTAISNIFAYLWLSSVNAPLSLFNS